MKKQISIFIFFVVVISILSCDNKRWEGKTYIENGVNFIKNPERGIWPTNKLNLIHDLVIGNNFDDHQQFFYQVRAIKVDSDGRIFVLDSGNFRIVVFDRNGSFLFTFGRSGAGPGEFGEPTDMAIDKSGNIYVLDRSHRRIEKYNSSGIHLSSTKIQLYTSYIDVLSEDVVLISGMLPGKFGAFGGLFDLKSKKYKLHLEYKFESNLKITAKSSISLEERYQVLSDGEIYLAVPFPYEILKFNLDGNLKMRIFLNDSRIKPPIIKIIAEGRGISIREKGHAGPCFRNSKGYLLNNCQWEDKNVDSIQIKTGIDFFDQNGKFLTTLNLSNNQRMIYLDNNDLLYLLEPEPFEKIIRCKIKETHN